MMKILTIFLGKSALQCRCQWPRVKRSCVFHDMTRCDDTGKGQNHIPASAKNHTVGREKEEKRNPQEPKPPISTPEVKWSTARAGGPCRAPTPGVMSRWNCDTRTTKGCGS